jgi:hypothetical protein
MRLKGLIVLFFVFLSFQDLEAVDLEGLKLGINTGFTYMNSKSLNTVTQGLNAGYGTDFGNIHIPMLLNFALMVDIGRSSIGIESAYEFANRGAYSAIYNFVENISYSAIPFGLKYQYEIHKNRRWLFTVDASTGIMFVSFNMGNTPSITGNDVSFNSSAKAWYFTSGLGSTYFITDLIGVNASLNFRYAQTSAFRYSADDGRHNSGDEVRFSDGSGLTINLLGLQFLLGLVLNWSL